MPAIKTKPDGSKVIAIEGFSGKSRKKCEVIGSFLENILRKQMKEPPSTPDGPTIIGIEKSGDGGVSSLYIELSLFELMELKEMHRVVSKLTDRAKAVFSEWKSDGSGENNTYTSIPHTRKTWELYLLREVFGHIKAFHSDVEELTAESFIVDAIEMKNDAGKILLVSHAKEIKPLLEMEGID